MYGGTSSKNTSGSSGGGGISKSRSSKNYTTLIDFAKFLRQNGWQLIFVPNCQINSSKSKFNSST